jgi:hypothetical protein
MTKINLHNILQVSLDKDPNVGVLSTEASDCIHEAMRDCSKVVMERVLKNLSTGVKYEKADIEKVIKLTLKELE